MNINTLKSIFILSMVSIILFVGVSVYSSAKNVMSKRNQQFESIYNWSK